MKKSSVLITLFILFASISTNIFGQKPTFEKVKSVLSVGAGFTEDDFATLEKGGIVVKELDAKTDGEVAFSGAIMLKASRDIVFSAFRRAVEKQRKEISEQRGLFRRPPSLTDLTKLTIDKSEIRALKDCKDGDCSWSLSSDMIRQFNEIDWTAKDAEEKAENLIRQIMVDHTTGYLEKGDSVLMDYNDDPEPMSLSGEQTSLLDGLLWINDFAPEFKDYVREFPNKKLEGIEELATWEKVGVGFKSVIINTHTMLYKKDEDGIPQGLSLSKQIYANHYFHSSMSLTGIISFPQEDESFKTYVFFLSHSRAGALTGTMGKIARVAVDGEAENKLTDVLKDTKRYTAYELGNEAAIEEEPQSGIIKRIFTNFYVLLGIVLIFIFGAIVLFTRRGSNKS